MPPRLPAPGGQEQRQALAADGKRIRGANRNGTLRYEIATLVEHTTGVPLASLNFHDENGELAAVAALLEEVSIAGSVITIDALHTTRDTAASIVEKHGADYLMTVKQNCSETYQALATMPWEEATGHFSEKPERGHGRVDRRHIVVLTLLKKTINYPHVAQVFRVRRERTDLTSGEKSIGAYGITSAVRVTSATAGLESRPLGGGVEESSAPRQDPRRGRLLGALRLCAGQPRDLQQHRAGGDSAPRPVGQRGCRHAPLYAAPESGLRGAAVSRLSRSRNPRPTIRRNSAPHT